MVLVMMMMMMMILIILILILILILIHHSLWLQGRISADKTELWNLDEDKESISLSPIGVDATSVRFGVLPPHDHHPHFRPHFRSPSSH